MKNYFKLLTILAVFMLSMNCCFAMSHGKIDKAIKHSPFEDTSTVAVSIKNLSTGRMVYEHNEKKLLHPASTIKILTTYEAFNILGSDYFFKTEFYKDANNNLYIKLGADPLLSTNQVRKAISQLKADGYTTFNNLYFDDSIIDRKEVSAGVMWDDDISYFTPKVSAYNLDGNILKINVSKNNKNILETNIKAYPTGIVSSLKEGKQQNITINRYNWNNPELIEISGNIRDIKPIMVPVSSMRRYFIHQVSKALDDNNIKIKNSSYSSKLVPDNAQMLGQIANPITDALPKALQKSDNLVTETLFKLASNKYYTSTGSDELGVRAFQDFYSKKGLKTDNIILVEGSGVSRNNLVSTEWMTKALKTIYKSDDFTNFKEYMAQPGDGTLRSRLLDLRGEVFLKTGSLANVSALAGYVYSKDGNVYSVCIFIQNFKNASKEVKDFENKIINYIYSK